MDVGERVRVGVVGCGMVAQAEHLPNLLQLDRRFAIAALAEPSRTVREAMAARYAVSCVHADYRALLAAGGIDAVVIAAPAAAHAEIVLAALDAGVHVFVEKPLCITLADADRVVAARDRAGNVVQVGYMKRHDPAWERMRAELPDSAEELRYIRVTCHDPEWVPFFAEGDIVKGTDVPAEVVQAIRRAESAQVEEAVGDGSPAAVFAFSDAYLGSMVHDVNVVHGLLERLEEPLPGRVVDAAWWNEGRAITGSVELANGARWDSAWIQLLDIREYQEQVAFYFRDSLRQLTFPSPWLKQSPTRYEQSGADDLDRVVRVFESHRESFVRELVHFHDCITAGVDCRTPPEQARIDIELLTQMFLAVR
jgi:Oxidoreductase family, NAD-binding Rossmann fold